MISGISYSILAVTVDNKEVVKQVSDPVLI